ncbi:MAG: metal ABC transporter ATP-binding protein [Fimbriimonadaceae bacterium]|nr:metal ABC transporter ATP-binding protein [Fimbriimonadaceae bacterium]
MNALTIRDLTVSYQKEPVLFDIDLDLPAGQLCAIVGPNGAGKSTLLRSILGLQSISAGTISICDVPTPAGTKNLGYVPQRSSVDWDFPTNVFEVVLMGTYRSLGWFKRPGKIEKDRATHALESVGMMDLAHRQISELSGGQQQRVFLARALAQDAPVTLMDEPFAGIDAASEKQIFAVLRLLKEQQKTAIVVHHDLETVAEYFDHVTLLNRRIIASGSTTDIFTPTLVAQTYGFAGVMG